MSLARLSLLVLAVVPLLHCQRAANLSASPATVAAPIACASTPTNKGPWPHEAEVDRIVKRKWTRGTGGLAVGVVERGQLVFAKGYGNANEATKQPIDAHTRFDLASVSKQFTAVAVLRWVDRQHLELHAPISTYLPAMEGDIRLLDLLHMESGLPDYLEALDTMGTRETIDNATIVAWTLQRRNQRKPPRKAFDYCNTNYVLLATIVERVAGKSLGQVLREEVFEPNDMKETVLFDRQGLVIQQRAQGYENGEPVRDDIPIVGDGNVFSSLTDLARWDTALYSGTLLSAEMHRVLTTSSELALSDSQAGGANLETRLTHYGCGLEVDAEAGLLSHSGGWTGTSTWMGHWLAHDRAVIVLSNDESMEAEEVGRSIGAVCQR